MATPWRLEAQRPGPTFYENVGPWPFANNLVPVTLMSLGTFLRIETA
jgi:hypothetical protein